MMEPLDCEDVGFEFLGTQTWKLEKQLQDLWGREKRRSSDCNKNV